MHFSLDQNKLPSCISCILCVFCKPCATDKQKCFSLHVSVHLKGQILQKHRETNVFSCVIYLTTIKNLFHQWKCLIKRDMKESVFKISLKDANNVCKQKIKTVSLHWKHQSCMISQKIISYFGKKKKIKNTLHALFYMQIFWMLELLHLCMHITRN